MLTREQVKEQAKSRDRGDAGFIDGRDYARLVGFFPVSDWETFGFKPKEGVDPSTITVRKWTEDEVKKQLADDLSFAFRKALDQRGISASLMHSVILMWMWVLEDPLQHETDYAQYGLPLLKKVAVKYGLPNEIGDDNGDEDKYASGG